MLSSVHSLALASGQRSDVLLGILCSGPTLGGTLIGDYRVIWGYIGDKGFRV